jgi:hypothetical protein
MRYHEIASGMRVFVSSDEQAIINRASGENGVARDDLDERDRTIADQIVSKGLIRCMKTDGKVTYKAIAATDIWRDRI